MKTPAITPVSDREDHASDFPGRAWTPVLAVTAVTMVAGWVRWLWMWHPVRYDEAFSYLVYASGDGPAVWLAYTYPNNHLLHTLLIHLTTTLGGPQPAFLRAPAFIAGVALVPLAALLARRISGRWLDGVLAAMLVGASSILIEYSVNARGYSMVCAATLVMGIATVEILRDPERPVPWVLWILAAIFGLFTIPIMLYPIGLLSAVVVGHLLWRDEMSARSMRYLSGALLVSAVGAAALYLPSIRISGLEAVVANRFVEPLPIGDLVQQLPGLIVLAGGHWSRDLGWLALVPVVGVVVCAATGVRERNSMMLLPGAAPLIVVAAAIAQRVVGFPRVWLFLLPLLLVGAAVGLGEIVFRTPKRRLATMCVIGLVTISAVIQTGRTLSRDELVSEEPRTLVDAEQIVADLETWRRPTTTLAYAVPSGPSLHYYALLQGRAPWPPPEHPGTTAALVVVSPGQTLGEVIGANPEIARRALSPRRLKVYRQSQVWEVRLRSDL